MKIIRLSAEGFKRLKAVQITPDGNMVQITGANGQGKSSALDAIWAGFKGRAAGFVEPIRKGEDQATIQIKLGTSSEAIAFVITRKFTRDKHGETTVSLKVIAADGSEVRKSPQAVIDALIGSLSLDPLAFSRAAANDQFETLKRFVPGFDFEATAEQRKKLFDTRTDVNRRAKEARAAEESVVLPPGPKPKPIDVDAKIKEAEAAVSANAEIDAIKSNISLLVAEADRKLDEAERLNARSATLNNEAAAINAAIKEKLEGLEKRATVDVSMLHAEIAKSREVERTLQAYATRDAHRKVAVDNEAESNLLTDKIETLDKSKAYAIANAAMPVPDLSIGDGEVLYKGVPFANASHAEKLVVSASIAMAENPELRIIRCYEGSNLDQKSLGILAAIADSRQFQIWIERVEESGQIGFVIEDGENAS